MRTKKIFARFARAPPPHQLFISDPPLAKILHPPLDADGEVEHSTLKLPSQVSETPDKQQEEDEGDSKSTIHTAIREKVRDNKHLAATHMAVKYNKKKGVNTEVFSVGDKVTIGIPKMDRAKTDIPCEITEVFGDKVKTYILEQCLELLRESSVVEICRVMMVV